MPSVSLAAKASSLVSLMAPFLLALAACGETFTQDTAPNADASAATQHDGTTDDAAASDLDAGSGIGSEPADGAAASDATTSGPATPDAAASEDAGSTPSTCSSCGGASCSACGKNCCNNATEACLKGGCIAAATTGNECFPELGTAACVKGDVCAPTNGNNGICAKTCSTASDCSATQEPCVAYSAGPATYFICQCSSSDICDDGEKCQNSQCD